MQTLFERCYSIDELNVVKAHLACGDTTAERAIQRMKVECAVIYLRAKDSLAETKKPDEREALEDVLRSALELIGHDLAQNDTPSFVTVEERLKYNLDCIQHYTAMVQSLGLFLELATP